MSVVYCWDLCDVFAKKSVTDDFFCNRSVGANPVERIYLGSYFCGNMFMLLSNKELFASLAERARRFSLHITLVVPVLPERYVDGALKLISSLLTDWSDVVDELSVNDIPMLAFLRRSYPHVKICAGRLINKTLRDIRDREFFEIKQEPKVFGDYYMRVFEENGISCVEIDNTAREIEIPLYADNMEVAIHLPYVYATTCNICEFASIDKNYDHKFRPSDKCSYECLTRAVEYDVSTQDGSVKYYKFGCGVYFKNENLKINRTDNIRYIYNSERGVRS